MSAKEVRFKNPSELIIAAAKAGAKTVRVVFYPAFKKENIPGCYPYELIKELTKEKKQTFSVISEAFDIIELCQSSDVKSVTWIN